MKLPGIIKGGFNIVVAVGVMEIGHAITTSIASDANKIKKICILTGGAVMTAAMASSTSRFIDVRLIPMGKIIGDAAKDGIDAGIKKHEVVQETAHKN